MTHHKWKCSQNRTEMNRLCICTVNKLSLKSVNRSLLMTFWFPSGNNCLSESSFAVSKIYRKKLIYFLQNLHFLEIVPLQNINLVSVNNVSQHCLFFQLVTSNTFSSSVWTHYINPQFCLVYYCCARGIMCKLSGWFGNRWRVSLVVTSIRSPPGSYCFCLWGLGN